MGAAVHGVYHAWPAMLIVSELVRDVLCCELVAASNAAKAGVMSDVMSHVKNMSDILMSPEDFKHIDDNMIGISKKG